MAPVAGRLRSCLVWFERLGCLLQQRLIKPVAACAASSCRSSATNAREART